MRKILLLTAFVTLAGFAQAQRFFYIEDKNNLGPLCGLALQQGAQHLVDSPMASDYILTTDAAIEENAHCLLLHITVKDSVTLRAIFQVDERHGFSGTGSNAKNYLQFVVQAFIERNMNQLIRCAQDSRQSEHHAALAPGKDKT